MKCLTIKQPWAILVASGVTRYMVRNWRTAHRGLLAIHAGSQLRRAQVELCCEEQMRGFLRRTGHDYPFELPLRALLGTVQVVSCVLVTDENRLEFPEDDPAVYFGLLQPGRWVWTCTDARPLSQPLPMAGRLGIYPIPDIILTLPS
jgi:hypothetical protein